MLVPIQSHPALREVETDIFTLRYFAHCMQCTFCQDGCCQYGCDVTVPERERILAVKDELAKFVVVPPERWFSTEVKDDPEYEGGKFVRAAALGGRCVFASKAGRGCGIHAFAMATGRDYHAIKPRVCWLFPVTWDKGVLRPSSDVHDDLICRGTGPTLYEFAREELKVAFSPALVAELDALRLSAR
ncbi:MAG: YkgJ family cysteine cluster protein [Archangium sp.]|nr:YkgJ family cysteine cluster protein [Archangium sp.]